MGLCRRLLLVFVVVALCQFALGPADAYAAVFSIDTGRLTVAPDGTMKFVPKNPACPAWNIDPGTLWEMTLEKGRDPFRLSDPVTIGSATSSPRCRIVGDGVVLTYDELGDGKRKWDVDLEITVKRIDGEFRFSATLANNTKGWTVHDFRFPTICEIKAPRAQTHSLGVLWPCGLGQRFANPAVFGESREFVYPMWSGAMQWCAVEGEGAGLYLGCHDTTGARKTFAVTNEQTHYDFSLTFEPYCTPGKKWESPPVVLMPFDGAWHAAARRYRRWIDTWMPLAPRPDWVVNNSGWFLCILKQQNGDLMWRYDQLDEMADVADEWGLDVLGLFGWAHGGHDRSYPDYIPDPKMGGAEELKKAINRVQARGKKVILYANGQLIDSATEFYRLKGIDAMLQDKKGVGSIQIFNKFKATTSPIFVQACGGSSVWTERLIALGKQAQELGADGILYDLLGTLAPDDCYAKNHNHTTPASAWAEWRFKMMKTVVDELRKTDPDFVVMAEAVVDGLMRDVHYFHGGGIGAYPFQPTPERTTFPELFRYTYPELVETQRNPNPLLNRRLAHLACVFGLRHEIESRYTADVAYLKQKKLPTGSDYADCNSPPYVGLVAKTPPEPAAAYMRTLTDFERRHAAFLWQGRFVDTEGIEVAGKNILAKGFRAADERLGVVVWNYGEKAEGVALGVPGFRLEAAYEPEKTEAVDVSEPIPPESIRLYVWKKAGAK